MSWIRRRAVMISYTDLRDREIIVRTYHGWCGCMSWWESTGSCTLIPGGPSLAASSLLYYRTSLWPLGLYRVSLFSSIYWVCSLAISFYCYVIRSVFEGFQGSPDCLPFFQLSQLATHLVVSYLMTLGIFIWRGRVLSSFRLRIFIKKVLRSW